MDTILDLDLLHFDKLFIEITIINKNWIKLRELYSGVLFRFDPSKIVLLLLHSSGTQFQVIYDSYAWTHIREIKQWDKFIKLENKDCYNYQNYHFIYLNEKLLNSFEHIIIKSNATNLLLANDVNRVAINDYLRKINSDNYIEILIEPLLIWEIRTKKSDYGIEVLTSYHDPKISPLLKPIILEDAI